MRYPLVSVVTPARDAAKTLEGVISTVMEQTYPHVEHIIVDGGSRDGSIEILKRYDTSLQYWVSEEDEGIYHAMNKGIDVAGGEWLYFLGADDRFFSPDVLSLLFERNIVPEDVSLIIGRVVLPGGKVFVSHFNRLLYFKNTLHHQGAFYRSDIFKKYRYGLNKEGKIVEHWRISGDYDLNLRLLLQGVKHLKKDILFARCGGGISLSGRFTGYREEISIRRQYIRFPTHLFFDIFTLARYFYKKTLKAI